MPKRAGFSKRVVGHVAIRRDAVCRDGIGAFRAVENPPAVVVTPIDPGVAGAGALLDFADDEERVRVAKTVEEPERLRFAIARLPPGGHGWRIGAVGIAQAVAHAPAFLHQPRRERHRGGMRIEVGDDRADGSHVAVVGGESGGLECEFGAAERQGTGGRSVARGEHAARHGQGHGKSGRGRRALAGSARRTFLGDAFRRRREGCGGQVGRDADADRWGRRSDGHGRLAQPHFLTEHGTAENDAGAGRGAGADFLRRERSRRKQGDERSGEEAWSAETHAAGLRRHLAGVRRHWQPFANENSL